ncbi:NADPH:quinone oxidoreductase family protein [Phenylobacterium sp. LjRoot225]|uniref:NADPH:quinone oxidoreductase family protein n=1 Tax=Phenylobacterium sp. LjRoot225 TaxID=3342285 RepID=UPI003ECF30ED
MRALVCESYGPPESLKLRDIAIPEPGPGEVLIRTHVAGVNFPDTLIIENKYQIKPPLPFSPGGELSGLVAKVGPGVTGFRPGDRAAALTNWGAFAEYVVAQAARTTHVPDTMPLDIAAAFTMAYGTSHHALKQRAQLQPGETLLVLGASGGVGLAAVELGKVMGAHVIAGASSPEKLQIARDYGADQLIDYSAQDLKATLKAMTGGKGVDVIYDPVGDRLAEPAFRSIAWGGRYLVVGFAGGQIPSIPLNLPLVKGASIVGVFWGDFVARTAKLHAENMAELYAWYAEGRLRPLISQRFDLARGGEAIRWIQDRKAHGKVVVTLSDED